LPFCFFHGRYFLYLESALEVQDALSAQRVAKQVGEDFRVEQEETARRLLELEAQLEAVKQRTQVRERQEAAEAQRWWNEQLQEMQKVHELRVEKGLAQAVARQKAEMEAAVLWQKKAQEVARQEGQLNEQKQRLEREAEESRLEVQGAEQVLQNIRDEELQTPQAPAESPLAQSPSELRGLLDTLSSPAAVSSTSLAEGAAPVARNARPSSGDFRSAPPEFWAQLHAQFTEGATTLPPTPTKEVVKKTFPFEIDSAKGLADGDASSVRQMDAGEALSKHGAHKCAELAIQPRRRPWYKLPSVGPRVYRYEEEQEEDS